MPTFDSIVFHRTLSISIPQSTKFRTNQTLIFAIRSITKKWWNNTDSVRMAGSWPHSTCFPRNLTASLNWLRAENMSSNTCSSTLRDKLRCFRGRHRDRLSLKHWQRRIRRYYSLWSIRRGAVIPSLLCRIWLMLRPFCINPNCHSCWVHTAFYVSFFLTFCHFRSDSFRGVPCTNSSVWSFWWSLKTPKCRTQKTCDFMLTAHLWVCIIFVKMLSDWSWRRCCAFATDWHSDIQLDIEHLDIWYISSSDFPVYFVMVFWVIGPLCVQREFSINFWMEKWLSFDSPIKFLILTQVKCPSTFWMDLSMKFADHSKVCNL